MLSGRHILLGLTGSIAAYKAAMIVRALIREGAEVRVVMTPLAREFITPLTMATLSRNPIAVDFFDPEDGRWNSHVSLGEWADLYLVAPATANTLAKMATGVADNLLLTTYLSAKCPVMVAPAMDLDMWAHPATQQNLETLRGRGVAVVEPGSGELASGLVGKGRMAEAEQIVAQAGGLLEKKKSLRGLGFVVTAGPTVEAIDPVRFISNHSTGTMGYAIAGELARRGARVTLVTGPTHIPHPQVDKVVEVQSADQMYAAAVEAFNGADGAVMCAAVADYAPVRRESSKIKKSAGGAMSLELKETRDIAAELGRTKGARLLVGFALETDDELRNAQSKLERKNLDFIVLNSLRDEGAGFGTATNKITIVDRRGVVEPYPLTSKGAAAVAIVDRIEGYFNGVDAVKRS